MSLNTIIVPGQLTAGPFSKLPAEIRNGIYKLVLTVGDVDLQPKQPKQAKQPKAKDRKKKSTSQQPVALSTKDVNTSMLRVCRLFYTEASAIMYGTNTFHVPSNALPEFQSVWIRQIGPQNCQLIRSLEVKFTTEQVRRMICQNWKTVETLADAIAKATSIRSITFSHDSSPPSRVERPGILPNELVLAAGLNRLKETDSLSAYRICMEQRGGRVTLAGENLMRKKIAEVSQSARSLEYDTNIQTQQLDEIVFDNRQIVRTKLWYCVTRNIGADWTDGEGEGANIKLMQDFNPDTEMVRWIEELVCGAYRVSKTA